MEHNEKLLSLCPGIFGDAFHDLLREQYQTCASEGVIRTVECDYDQAMAALGSDLSPAQLDDLSQMQQLWAQLRALYGEYGFQAGMLSGFEQHFCPDAPDGFERHVIQKVMTMPQMGAYPKLNGLTDRCNALYERLYAQLSAPLKDHLVSVGCAWEQRCHSAAMDGFSLGNRSALAVLDKVM